MTISGGKSSAYCAYWAFKHYKKKNIILYFNDTKWEDVDTYRFLNDLSNYFQHPITVDSDGRTPEQIFYDEKILGSNLIPICSKILKAKRLEKFIQTGDIVIFGIGVFENHRAKRIRNRLENKYKIKTIFPLIDNYISNKDIDNFLKQSKIKQPRLYNLGFKHNNCSGGCVRAGKKQWDLLYKTLPVVYKNRERIEIEFSKYFNRNVTFLKDISLKEYRKILEKRSLQSELF